MTPKLIGLCGYTGAGKSTVSACAIFNPVTSYKALEIYHMGFADGIYKMLAAIVPDEIMYNKSRWNEPLDELNGRTVRFAANTLGVDWGRNRMGRNIWIVQTRHEIERVMKLGISVLIDNIRFPDEFDMLQEFDCETIAMHRPELYTRPELETERYIATMQRRCKHSIVNCEGRFAETVLEMRKLLTDIVNGDNCSGHVASDTNPKICGRCGIHIDSLRPPEDE